MEDRFPRSDQEHGSDEDEEKTGPNLSRGRAGFLQRKPAGDALFKRIFETNQENDDEEEEDESGVEKKTSVIKRFRKPFRSVFRRGIVAPPDHIAEQHTDQNLEDASQERDTIVPFSNFSEWLRKMSTSIDRDEPVYEEDREPVHKEHRESSVGSILAAMSSGEGAPEDPSEASENASIESNNTVSEHAESLVAKTANQEPESLQQILARQSTSLERPDATELHEQAETSVQHVTNETYVNNGGWGPALVVDQLSRHRDRKIKRVDKKQNKHIEAMQDSQKKQAEDIQYATDNINLLRRQAEMLEKSVSTPKIESKQEKSSAVPERLQSPASLPNKFIPHVPERAERYSTQQRESAMDVDIKTTPETIQKTVEKAAETSVPIESLYERRHELKGSEDFAATADAAIRASSMVGLPIATSQDELPASENVEQPTVSLPPQTSPQNDLYKQAAKGGVLVAFVVIVAFIIIYMLAR